MCPSVHIVIVVNSFYTIIMFVCSHMYITSCMHRSMMHDIDTVMAAIRDKHSLYSRVSTCRSSYRRSRLDNE